MHLCFLQSLIFFIFSAPAPLEGVYLFLGYSRKDARMMMEGRKEVSDKVPDTEEEEEQEVVATVQQAVSYFTSNNNKVISHSRNNTAKQ